MRETLKTPAPRNAAALERLMYRAAGQLDADEKNARTHADAEHARIGRALCIAAFTQLTTTPRRPRA